MSIFSERVIYLMNKQKLNQKELAYKCSVTESAISYYIKGVRTPRSDVLARMAKALGASTDYLLGYSDANISNNANKNLYYIQRNLGKLDNEQLKRAETILKAAFNDIFDDDEDDD